MLDRAKLFAGQPGLRAVGPDDPAEPFDRRFDNTFEVKPAPPPDPDREARPAPVSRQLQTCIGYHASPGIRSVLSMRRGLREQQGETFRTYAWDVELSYTVKAKTKRYDWGLLQGKLEAK